MRLGEILVAQGFLTAQALQSALKHQHDHGGRLGDIIIAMRLMTADQMSAAIAAAPASPRCLAETGIGQGPLLNLLLKFMHLEACETAGDLTEALKLPRQIIDELLQEAVSRKLIQSLGARALTLVPQIRYGLSDDGRAAAAAALSQTQYLRPAPVALAAFQAQLRKQSIRGGAIKPEAFKAGLAGMEGQDIYVRKLLPAVNGGRTILLYGPPGNGKTTLTARIAAMLEKTVYIPYAVEISGQIMKVFDPGVHKPVTASAEMQALLANASLLTEAFDDRWVACRRPFVTVAGELTMEMLDLQYNADARFYDAPAHVKALNGVFVIDDFGRQRVSPTDLLNRWISPMENQIDYMKLHTGQIFSLPFDQLLVFSTNLEPQNLMDPAFLRRIPYKIKISGPGRAEYRRIFDATAKSFGLTLPDDVFEYIVALLARGNFELAGFQPRFICDQAAQYCRSFTLPPILTQSLAQEALANLYVQLGEA
jgi:hypothetical protein